MPAFEPEIFGKYFLVDKIATGGMAEIFKAKTYSHGGFENLLVIKRILAHLSDNDEFVEMFIDEAKVSVALQHANIIRIYDFGKLLDNYFIAMECVDGKDSRNILKKLSKRRKFLPVEFAAFIAHEACKGLEYAHRKTDLHGRPYGIVHRDISPSNVLVSYEGDVKVADFGIAKAESNAYNTKDGVLKGKFEYMSPEQARGESIDHRSDLFSLGIILHETLTGRRLFKTESETATLEKIKKADVVPPSRLNARVPDRLDAIVLKALARDREERYQSAKEMQDDIAEFLFPATPDVLRQSLARFMQELFDDEIAEERNRLEAGSKVAEQLRENAPAVDWDGHTSTTMTPTALGQQRRSMLPWALLGGVVLLIPALLGGMLALGITFGPSMDAVEEAAPTTGSIDVMMMPAGRILVNGEVADEGDATALEDLDPGTYTIRLEAEGHEPYEQEVEVVAGERVRVRQTLEAVPVEAPKASRPAPSAGPTRAIVRFTSEPSGATVFLDGKVLGRTPFTWSEARPDQSYRVVYDLHGHESASGTLEGLVAGEETTYAKELRQRAATPGQLSVALIGGGWAYVWVDGKKLEATAPLNGYSLPAGTHEIRVENPAVGIDHTEVVTVASGGRVTVRAKPK